MDTTTDDTDDIDITDPAALLAVIEQMAAEIERLNTRLRAAATILAMD